MGALDGVTHSNSNVFNKGLDWKGVLIEADPNSYEKLVNKHPAVAGFLEFASEVFKVTWDKELIDNALIVKCRRLDTLLHDAVGRKFHFDFFSLDVEGVELRALQSLNFDENQVGVILVEADGSNPRKDEGIKTILDRARYAYAGKLKASNWYVNQNFDVIYADVTYDDQKAD